MTASGVYEIRNAVTGEPYISSASDTTAAWRRHKRRLSAGHHANMALQEAWNIYGEAAFVFEVVEPLTDRTQLHQRAKARIAEHRPNYNMDFWPREHIVTQVYDQNGVPTKMEVHPYRRMEWTEYDETGMPIKDDDRDRNPSHHASPATPAAEPMVQQQTTYRMPIFDYDVPLLHCSDGNAYVPVDAWYAMLGTRPSYHFGRIKQTFLWEWHAHELPYTPLPAPPASPSALSAGDESAIAISGSPDSVIRRHKTTTTTMNASTVIASNSPNSASSGATTQRGWCLPLDTFTSFTCGFTRKQQPLSDETWKRIHAYDQREWAEEERKREEQHARERQFLTERKRLTRELVDQQHTRERLTQIVAEVRRHLHDATDDDLIAYDHLTASGMETLDALTGATRAALEQMQHTKVREYNTYDFYNHPVESYSIPLDPQLPDSSDMEAQARTFALWQRSYIRWLRAHGISIHKVSDGDDFSSDTLN